MNHPSRLKQTGKRCHASAGSSALNTFPASSSQDFLSFSPLASPLVCTLAYLLTSLAARPEAAWPSSGGDPAINEATAPLRV